MNIIDNIISNFYYCCNLSVIAVDFDFNEIAKIGYKDELFCTLKELDVYKDINMKRKFDNNFILNYKNDINYIVTPISKFDKYKGSFIIGPFNCLKKHSSNSLFRPEECLNHISDMMTNISDSIFSNNMSTLNFNVHIRKAIVYVHENYTSDINIDDLCEHLGINKSYFCKLFKTQTKLTFSNFLNKYRIEKSKHLLLNTDLPILDVGVSVGFNSQSYYSMIFKKFINKTPLEYRNAS